MILGIMSSIKETAAYGVFGLLLFIDGCVYWFVSKLFSLYTTLASATIIDATVYEKLSSRVYLFIGVIALFIVTISLLKAMVNPDELNKGTKKIATNFATSLAMVIMVPTVFAFLMDFQAAIFYENIIGKVFVNVGKPEASNATIKSVKNITSDDDLNISITAFEYQGNYLALTALTAFLNEGESETLSSGEEIINKDNVSWKDAKTYIMYTGDFKYIASFVEQIVGEDQKLDYTVIISTGCGIYLIYILLSFSLDMGVRVVKLAFYQMIAPIPIMMRILPSKEGQFTKWVKNVISTYAEVFVRLIVVYVAVFLCSEVLTSLTLKKSGTGLIGKVVIFLGIFTFAKQAPKLLKDALGFEGGGLSFGIKGKLTDVPVAGKTFAAGYGVANKFQGAATGTLGAGYSSLINGGKFKDGAKFGAASGWKNGGKQFGSMHQETYRQMGYKGKAGWFGGQSWVDKRIDDNRDKFSDNFKDNVLRKWVQDFENNPDGIWQKSYRQKSNEMNNYYKNLLTKSRNDYSNLVSNRDNEIKKLNDKFASDFMEFQNANPNVEQSVLNAKVKEREAKEQASIKAINEKYANQINTLQKNIHDSESLLSGGSATRINSKGFQETFSIDSDSKKYAIGVARDAEPTYDNRKTIDKKRLNEKSVKEYTNSLEGQQAIAVQQQAMKNLQKDGPTPARPDSGGNKK